MSSKYISYKNSKIHFTDTGVGPAIILVHGFLESVTIWNNLHPLLREKNRLVCIDLPGHGYSADITKIHRMEDMAKVVNAIIEHLVIEKVVLFGHSMGGYVCLAFAEMFPNKVEGLGLINSTPLTDSEEKKVIRDRAIEAVQQNYKTFARIAISSLFSKNNRLRLKNDIDLLVDNALKMDPKSVIAAITGMKVRKDRSSIFLNGSFKKLLLLADHDPVLNTSDLLELTKDQPNITKIIPGGHMSFLENFKDYSYSIIHFIEFLYLFIVFLL